MPSADVMIQGKVQGAGIVSAVDVHPGDIRTLILPTEVSLARRREIKDADVYFTWPRFIRDASVVFTVARGIA
jgi:hypothetical protein